MTTRWGRAARRAAVTACGVLVLGLTTGCATSGPGGQTRDPLQGVNRAVFGFNVFVDDWALGPTARGYKKITHPRMRQSVTNFFYNLDFPKRFVASVGQAEGEKAATEVGRFVVNTTIGVAGLFDPATHFGMARFDEDIGQMFGRWGVPGGPYWVLPLLGPSNPRDTTGYIAQVFLNPFFWLDYHETNYVSLGTGLFRALNARAEADEQIAAARRSALDYYIFVRDAFIARREAQIRNEPLPEPGAASEAQDDLYDDDLYDDPGAGDGPEAGEETNDAEAP